MFRIAALGVLLLSCLSSAAPDYGGSSGFIKVSPSYGAPPVHHGGGGGGYGKEEQACYPKQVTKIMTKDVQDTQAHYATGKIVG